MKLIFILCLTFLTHELWAKGPIKLCYENVTVYPWITGDNQGLVISELHMVEKIAKVKFQMVRLPWKRCQIEAQNGNYDGIIAASYNKERAQWGVYPYSKNENEVDNDLRLHTDRFYLYAKKNSDIAFVNGKILNLDQRPIGVQLGYSIGNNLVEWGYKIQSSFSETKDLLKELNMDILKAVVLQDHESKRVLAQFPNYNANVKRVEPPIKVSDQYLLFTKTYFKNNKATAQKIWQAIKKARMSQEYIDLNNNI